MKFFFEIGDRFMQKSDWRDMALVKFCLFAMGVIVGCLLPQKSRKLSIAAAAAVFAATYVPLMTKVFRIIGIEKIKPK